MDFTVIKSAIGNRAV